MKVAVKFLMPMSAKSNGKVLQYRIEDGQR